MMLTNSSGSITDFRASRTVSSAIAMAFPLAAIILPRQGASLIVAKAHQNLLPHDLHIVGLSRLCGRHANRCARLHVEFGPMSRTSDRSVLWIKRPVAQWPPVMRTYVVERVIMPGRADQHHQPLANLNQQLARIGNFAHVRARTKVGHLIEMPLHPETKPQNKQTAAQERQSQFQ